MASSSGSPQRQLAGSSEARESEEEALRAGRIRSFASTAPGTTRLEFPFLDGRVMAVCVRVRGSERSGVKCGRAACRERGVRELRNHG